MDIDNNLIRFTLKPTSEGSPVPDTIAAADIDTLDFSPPAGVTVVPIVVEPVAVSDDKEAGIFHVALELDNPGSVYAVNIQVLDSDNSVISEVVS